jgi:hypothetical protein
VTEQLRNALVEVGDEMPPARLPADLWRQGRRARLRERLISATAVAAVVLALAVALPMSLNTTPQQLADGGDAVPNHLYHPWMWQATVQQAPAGPASVLFSGAGSVGLRGSDIFDHEGKVAVVGRDGSYRMLLYGGRETVAGEQVQLSPDGRYVAQDFVDDPVITGWIVVTDLTTGRSRSFRGPDNATCCARPVAWSRDGHTLLAVSYDRGVPRTFDPVTHMGIQPARLALLDLTSGAVRTLLDLGDLNKLRTASLAAFSSDGQHIAVTVGDQIRLIDTTGTVEWTASMGPRRYLGGVGAFTPDGRRITVLTLDGCRDKCDRGALAARRWSFGYLDAATGADTTGPVPASVTAMAVRMIGWRYGTDVVALTYRPEHDAASQVGNDTDFWAVGGSKLVALPADGTIEVLLDPPDEVVGMDVARDLLEAGRFGGPAREPTALPARPLILLPITAVAAPVLFVLLGLVGWRIGRRRSGARRPATTNGYPPQPETG